MNMSESLSVENKISIASSFLLESPPGEFNDVFNDVRTLVNHDEALKKGIQPAVEKYNMEQLLLVKSPEGGHNVIISEYAQIEENKFVDIKTKTTFTLDHLHLTTEAGEPYEIPEENEVKRAAIDEACQLYLSEHFPEGVCNVFFKNGNFYICIVDNKFKPSSFWNGKYRSIWTVPGDTAKVKGVARVNVHYFEDGNVQLNTTHDFDANVEIKEDLKAYAKSLVQEIQKLETALQTSINVMYQSLADETFKSLRRSLPITKSKIDWHKIANYKIGSELAAK